jgi:hypothetical protein
MLKSKKTLIYACALAIVLAVTMHSVGLASYNVSYNELPYAIAWPSPSQALQYSATKEDGVQTDVTLTAAHFTGQGGVMIYGEAHATDGNRFEGSTTVSNPRWDVYLSMDALITVEVNPYTFHATTTYMNVATALIDILNVVGGISHNAPVFDQGTLVNENGVIEVYVEIEIDDFSTQSEIAFDYLVSVDSYGELDRAEIVVQVNGDSNVFSGNSVQLFDGSFLVQEFSLH